MHGAETVKMGEPTPNVEHSGVRAMKCRTIELVDKEISDARKYKEIPWQMLVCFRTRIVCVHFYI